MKHDSLTISTQDLIIGMVRLGYKKRAKKIGEEFLQSEELNEVLSVSGQGSISEDLEYIMRYIASTKTQQKIICKINERQLIFYPFKNENLLVEIIDNKKHTFLVQPLSSNFSEILSEFYSLDTEKDESETSRSIKVTYSFYDLMHNVVEEELEEFIEEKVDRLIMDGNAKPTKEFLRDFKVNKQKVNQIVFINDNHINFTEVFVPGKDCIWFVEYENIKKQQLTISSISSNAYLQKLERLIKEFFTDFLKVRENKIRNKVFLFKRGLMFFAKSNALVIVCVALILINKNSWAYDGDTSLIFLVIQSEILILFLAFFACFQREKAKLKILNK